MKNLHLPKLTYQSVTREKYEQSVLRVSTRTEPKFTCTHALIDQR